MLVFEKVPFIILSLISLTISMMSVLKYHTVVNYQMIPIYTRIYNLFVSIILYLRNIAWPVELSILYPFPKSIPAWHFSLALASVVLVTVIAFMTRKGRPWLIVGWCWFLVALAPASGLIQSGLWPAMANRFMYLPMIGLFMMVIWEGDQRLRGRYSRVLKVVLCVAMLVYFAVLTRVQNLYFSNSYALFNRCLEVAGDNEVAFNNIGDALASSGRVDEAMKYFAKSIKLNPKHAIAYYNYGICLVMKGDDQNAIPYFLWAIKLDPKRVNSYLNIGLIQKRRGYIDEAVKLMEKALEIDQNDLSVHYDYGMILAEQGKFEEAIPHYVFVVRRDPTNVPARINLSQAYEETGLYNKAMDGYKSLNEVISHNKGYIYYRIARVYSQQRRFKECEDYLEIALKDGFSVLEFLKIDKGFINFRETKNYTRFLENQKIKLP